MSDGVGWQEWFRKSIANKGYNPKTAAQKTWVYRGEEIKELKTRIATLEKQAILDKKVAEAAHIYFGLYNTVGISKKYCSQSPARSRLSKGARGKL